MSGTLIGIGIGPGSADLVTERAAATLADAGVVAHMHATGKPGLAIEMVRTRLRDDVIEIAIPVPMDADEATRRAAYDAAIPALREHLNAGRDVAFVCEGDALFYGSFQYVQDRLADDCAIQVIPGVTSVTASAAVAGLALTRGNQTFQALPATLRDGALAARLADNKSSFAIMKLG